MHCKFSLNVNPVHGTHIDMNLRLYRRRVGRVLRLAQDCSRGTEPVYRIWNSGVAVHPSETLRASEVTFANSSRIKGGFSP